MEFRRHVLVVEAVHRRYGFLQDIDVETGAFNHRNFAGLDAVAADAV
jgi:hypothetical protein